MNDELKQQLAEKLLQYLSLLEQGIANTSSLAAEQVPQVLRELIIYTVVSDMAQILACIFFTAVAYRGLKFFWGRANREEGYSSDTDAAAATVAFCVCGVFAFLICCENVDQIIKASVAPRVFILEYVKDLTK